MDTKILFENFHEKNREEITKLVKQFAEQDFFFVFPELRNEVSILITGSVASGFQDKNSDIDFVVFFQEKKLFEKYKPLIIKEFKGQNGQSKKAPLELHGGNIKLFEDVENELNLWNKDWMLREIADAIVAYDPENIFKNLQQKYSWYPDEIFKDKMNWLFAESAFLIFDRYKTGMTRKSLFYIESVKIRVIRLFLITLVMLGKKYPKSEKHLQKDIEIFGNVSGEILSLINSILTERDGEKVFSRLCILRKEIENILVERKIITKENNEYWFGSRQSYKVEIEK